MQHDEEHQDEAKEEDDETEEERRDAVTRDWRAVNGTLQAIATATSHCIRE